MTRVRLVVVAIVAIFVAVAGWHFEYGTQRTATFTVKTLDDQANSKGHTYLVFTTRNNVYKDTDSWLHGKTDSSNVWAMLQQGHTYTCPVYGWRSFVLSSYPDILDGCKDVTAQHVSPTT